MTTARHRRHPAGASNRRRQRIERQLPIWHGVVVALAISLMSLVGQPAVGAGATGTAVAGGDWPSYLHDVQHSAADTVPSGLNPSTASKLAPLWTFKTGGTVAASATVVNQTVYLGSWDGYEYALDAATGALKWRTYLGVTSAPNCSPPNAGVTSTATVDNNVVYVGGGDSYWYALDANSGAVLWQVYTGDNSATGGHYNWSSPVIANGFAYIGIASLGDCPLVQGEVLKVDLSTHLVVATWKAVPDGRVGGGVWTTPTLDPSTNTLFVSTGTEGGTEPLAQAFVSLDATTLAFKDVWKLPENLAVTDSDFGTSPVLFTDSTGRALVGSVNKNGLFYALDRGNLSAGPVWQATIAVGGSCPTCGDGSVSSAAWAQGTIFQAGGNTSIGGVSSPGSVRSIDPTTGNFNWEHADPAPVVPAIAYSNGLVIDAAGKLLEVLDANTGNTLFATQLLASSYGPPSVAEGMLFANSVDGTVYAYAPSGCPTDWGCADVGPVGLAGNQGTNGTTWTVQGAGADISAAPDAFHFVWQPLPADGSVSAQVVSQQPTNSYAKAGVMLRATLDPGSPYYAALITPQHGIRIQYRSAQGGAMSNAATPAGVVPAYLMVSRVGQVYSAYTSTDGTNWYPVAGSTRNLAGFTGTALAGMAVTSHDVTKLSTVTFNAFTIGPPPQAPCPSSWSCADIGNVGLAGSQYLTGSTWSLQGAGADISSTVDAFHYVWQALPSDGAVSAEVTSQQATNSYAKAGVMLRASTDPSAPYYAALITPQYGIRVQYRAVPGGTMANAATPAGATPVYLRVGRVGSTFTAYTSADGVTWTAVTGSSRTLTNLSGSLLAGMAVTSHNVNALCQVTMTAVSVG